MQRHGLACGSSPRFQMGQDSDGDFERALENGTSQWLMINAVALPIRLSLKGGTGQGLKLMANAAAPPI